MRPRAGRIRPLAGHTVTPISPATNEAIVGHVLARLDDEHSEVLWMSDQRGIFTVTEYDADVVVCVTSKPTDYPRWIAVSVAAVTC